MDKAGVEDTVSEREKIDYDRGYENEFIAERKLAAALLKNGNPDDVEIANFILDGIREKITATRQNRQAQQPGFAPQQGNINPPQGTQPGFLQNALSRIGIGGRR